MRNAKLFLLVILSLPTLVFADPGTITFKKLGKVVKTVTVESLKKEYPSELITVYEGHEESEASYRGVKFNTLLEKVYGGTWDGKSQNQGVDEALFSCIDGYQPSVPLNKALTHQAYLVYERANGKPFEFVDKTTGKVISYGPLYLVWENIKDNQIKMEGLNFWPYQVATVDLITFAEQFKKLIPAQKLSKIQTRGFIAYRIHCMQCHRINGSGGDKGIELNYPASVTEYFKPQWLKKFITNPQSVRKDSPMPPFNTDYPHYQRTVREIIEYLKAISKSKQ